MNREQDLSEMTEILSAHIMQENMVGSEAFPYVPGRQHFNWNAPTSNPIEDVKYDYERKLYAELRKNASSSSLHDNRPIRIIGGRGTGKTTVVMEVLKKLSDEGDLAFLHINMNQWDDRAFDNESEDNLNSRFAAHLANRFRSEIPTELELEEELYDFLPWCLNQRNCVTEIISHIEALSNFLRKNSAQLQKLSKKESYGKLSEADLFEEMVERRGVMIDALTSIDEIWYQLVRLIYSQKWSPTKAELSKKILVLDNIDPVAPSLQRFASGMIQKITLTSGIQTVIPMRPHTRVVSASATGADWCHEEEHCSPPLVEVINTRLASINSNGNKNLSTVVAKITAALNNDTKHLSEILLNTSGLDVRTGLINFSNFIERLLGSKGINFDFGLDQSEICRLFFLGDRNRFNYSYAENLFFISHAEEQIYTSCKLFILDYLLRVANGSCPMSKIRSHLIQLGFRNDEISRSFSNLLSRNRSLIWSDDGFDVMSLGDRSILRASPLAFTYFYRLFGEFYYTEVCAMDRQFSTISVSEVMHFEKRLIQEEMKRLLHLVDNAGPQKLADLFPSPRDFLGVRHWTRFRKGARFRIKGDPAGLIDPNRVAWLSNCYGRLKSGSANDLDWLANEFKLQ